MITHKNKAIIEKDVILIYIENNPTIFARIEDISPDIKSGWWQVKLLILQIPLIVTTWILDNEQIRGADFTMNGTPIRIEKVVVPTEPPDAKSSEEKELDIKDKSQRQARIISLNPRSNQN